MKDPRRSGPVPEYAIGKNRPPIEYRWPKGFSGNPRGRPRAVLSLRAAFEKELGRKVTVTMNSSPRRVPLLQAIIAKLSASAAHGSHASAKLLLDVRSLEPKPTEAPAKAPSHDPHVVANLQMLMRAVEAYYAHKVYLSLYGPLDDEDRKMITRDGVLDWFPFWP